MIHFPAVDPLSTQNQLDLECVSEQQQVLREISPIVCSVMNGAYNSYLTVILFSYS